MFDEGSGTIAYDSAGTNDGALVNGPVWTTGQINDALGFDGVNDYVDVGDPIDGSLDFGAGDSFTISAWIKWNKTVYDQRDAVIVHKVRTDSGGYFREGYALKVWMGTLVFGLEDIGGANTQIRGATYINDNAWHHVVGVRDTATDKVYVYVDGGSDAAPVTDVTNSTLANSIEFGIGRTHDYYQTYFGGILDDVQVYNRALSDEEVEELYWDSFSDYEAAVLALEDVIQQDAEMMQMLDEAMQTKDRAYTELEELLKSGDYGDLKKSDIISAKQKVSSAINSEEQSIAAMEKGIESLDAALEALGVVAEPEPNSP
jgi:hypothetical protein